MHLAPQCLDASLLEIPRQATRSQGNPELLQRFPFDLTNPLARQGEPLPDRLQGALALAIETETPREDIALPRRE